MPFLTKNQRLFKKSGVFGQTLITKIRNSVLYEFAVELTGLIAEHTAQNGLMDEYSAAVQEAVNDFEAAFNKSRKHPFTVKINEKHEQRISLYTALKRQISADLKISFNPLMIAAAGKLKKEMKECGLWVNEKLSYSGATLIIHQILQKFSEEPYSQWVAEACLQTIVEALGTVQNEYEALKQDRIEDIANDATLTEKNARKNLIEVVLSTLAAIDFGVRRNKEVFINLASDVFEIVTETNALTRASETRVEHSGNGQPDEEEPEAEHTDTEAGEAAETVTVSHTFYPGNSEGQRITKNQEIESYLSNFSD